MTTAMSMATGFHKVVVRTRGLSLFIRCNAAATVVGCAFALRSLVDPVWPNGYPFLVGVFAILASAALFRQAAGLLATALSGLLAVAFYLPTSPGAGLVPPHLVSLGAFLVLGVILTLVIEALHGCLEHLEAIERRRALQLREFRHRTRNDLANLASLLLLRGRGASQETRSALKDAAAHAMALARVHARLVAAEASNADEPVVDTREFVVGLVHDIMQAQGSMRGGIQGIRPVVLLVDSVATSMTTERAINLGLAINECVTNALKFAFPAERTGKLTVSLQQDGEHFVLDVTDDGVGFDAVPSPPEAPRVGPSGLGTRLLRALASQLQGTFTRDPAPGGGTLCRLRFPIQPSGIPAPT